MRLTNLHRSAIVDRAVAERFDREDERLQKAEHRLGMRFYRKLVPAAERRAVEKLSRKWVAKTTKLVVNARGANLQFNVEEEVTVPPRSSSWNASPLGALEGEDADLAVAHHDALQDARKKRREAAKKTRSLLDSVSSLKQLEDVWPEGKPFYQHLGSEDRLPVPVVRDVNAALGIGAA